VVLSPRSLRVVRHVALACAVLVWRAPGVRAADFPPVRPDGPPFFFADLAIALDAAGRPVLSVGVLVPYDELQWVRVARGYAAGAELAVAFEATDGGREYGDAWTRKLVVGSFQETVSSVASLVERRTVDLPSGRYRVRVTLRDVNSGSASSGSRDLDVPDFSRVPVGIAGIELGLADSAGTFRPVPGRRYGREVERLAARLAVFDRRPGEWPRSYPVRFRILGERGETVREGVHTLVAARPAEALILRPDSTALFVGTYVLEADLGDGGARWRVERAFEVEHSGPPDPRELKALLEPLALVATEAEIDSLDALPADARAAGWDRFWARRDPTPDTPRNEAMLEFMTRVRHVERNFRELGPGWRSDRGRIYIRYGEPDQVERSLTGSEGRNVEVWYYNRPHRRFVFVDRDGFGRYALVSPWIE